MTSPVHGTWYGYYRARAVAAHNEVGKLRALRKILA
jgi:hypothetical protein